MFEQKKIETARRNTPFRIILRWKKSMCLLHKQMYDGVPSTHTFSHMEDREKERAKKNRIENFENILFKLNILHIRVPSKNNNSSYQYF